MRITTALFAAGGLAIASLMPAQAAADAKIYAYPTNVNYCPAGLQPITIAGVICCGVPNQSMTYQQVMAHPVPVRKHAPKRHYKAPKRHHVKADCPIGTKGCTYD